MQIKIIFDKVTEDKFLHAGWGISFLIDDKILFDTGEKGEWLLENMHSLGVNINKIEAVVISHDHWDHWGGLWDLLIHRDTLKIYACPGFSKEFKEKVKKLKGRLIEVKRFKEIVAGIYTTGEISGNYQGKYMAEQAIVLKTNNGLTVITGCAHPGILKVLEKVKTKFSNEPIYFVLGGFHLMKLDERIIEIIVEDFKKMGVKKVGPTHCSGELAEKIFKKIYQDNFVTVKVKEDFEV
jgi:7,8-dihydropterin-6-yl-methyl-4-(beta-D-ribofuranosyl)aminobenzene 5'-phosphate synthase